jgi:RNA-directed DNA polymerase
VSPRLRAKTQDHQTLRAAWQAIPWTKVQRQVFRLQKRIDHATQRGEVRTVHKLQDLLSKSWYAQLLAVRRVTQDNRGQHTAGIDGVKSLTPPQRLRLADQLRLTSTAPPLRRTWRPKPGSADKRPLGIPTLHERARQTLVRQALEPEWEAKLSPHTYGFRPGRSGWDASAAVFHRIKFRPQHLLKVDIAQCFERLDPAALLRKLHAPSGIRRQGRAWLRSGIMEADTLTPTTAGTPQGGTVSPLLALIALHGMDEAIPQVYPEARGIAYAEDGLVLHPDRSVLDPCQQLLAAWRAGIGLTLNVNKTRISHTLAGDQPGLDFLGFHIRQYRVGKHQSGKGPGGYQRLGYKTLITPATANIKEHLAELGRVIRAGQNWPQAALIHALNPKIRGWANYYRTWGSQATFSRLDRLMWEKLRSWARRRHPNKAARWVAGRYWHRRASRQGFATPATRPSQAYLASHSDTASLRHAKVTGARSPYDGDGV